MIQESRKNPVNKNDIVEITIEDLGTNCEGIGRIQGYALFIKGAIPGDVVKVKIIKVKKTYGYGKLMEVVKPSGYRVDPKCLVAGKCGGCQLQHMDYKHQLEYKQNKVKSCLERIGGFQNVEMEPIIGMDNPYYYRNKAQFPVGRNKEGRAVTGFYVNRTHSIIDIEHCCIQSQVNDSILKIVKEFINNTNISTYDEVKHEGLVRHILTRVGFVTGEIMVCIIINGRKLPKQELLIEKLCKIEGMTSICLSINEEKTNVILGNEVMTIWGQKYITDFIGNIKYQISPLSFYQVNPVQTEKLYQKALEYADLNGSEIVWDLYCGIGTISLFLAQKAKQVYGVEIIPQAIEDAKQNAAINGIKNAEFFTGAAEEILPKMYNESNGFMNADVVVVDPPRKGCEESLLDTIIQIKPKKIVYVSCDPATLARDLKYLGERGFELKKVQAVDQFGMTGHVECVVLMSKIGK